jgi:hypothetical protein
MVAQIVRPRSLTSAEVSGTLFYEKRRNHGSAGRFSATALA